MHWAILPKLTDIKIRAPKGVSISIIFSMGDRMEVGLCNIRFLTNTAIACASILTFVSPLFCAPSIGASLNASNGPRILEEVIVVAQKRPQNLQEVPVAVTTFSGKQLQISGIKDVFDLSHVAPALDVRQAGQSRATTFRVRGVGTFANNFGLESSVGLYVDGVYRSRQGSMINNMLDMARVEVLRGPQGTLFGRNTLAGAILFDTVVPSPGITDGFVEFSMGNYNLLNFSGAASLSALDDTLAFRASAFSSQRDGFVDDVHFGDGKLYDRNRSGIRLQTLYLPSDSLSLRLVADYSKRSETCCAALVVQDNLRPVSLPDDQTSYAGYDEVYRSLGGTVFTANQYRNRTTAVSALPVSNDEDSGFYFTVEWDLGSFKLTSISANRSYDSHNRLDGDHTDLMVTMEEAREDQEAWSQELRIAGEHEKHNYVAGLYFFRQELDSTSVTSFGEDANAIWSHGYIWYPGTRGQYPLEDIDSFPRPSFPLFAPNSGAKNSMEQHHRSYAVFGQVDHYLSETLMLTAGLRYTWEEKRLSGVFTQGSAPDFTDNVIAIAAVLESFPSIAPQDPVDESLSEGQVTYTTKLSWFLNDNTFFYASYGTGYKSGGTNTDRIDPELDYTFDPETSRALEVGWKATNPEQSLRVNLALHSTDIDDLQVNYLQDNHFVLRNAGNLETYGGELELTWLPTDSLTVIGAYARTEGEFKQFENGLCWIAYPFHTGQPDPGDASQGENPLACDRSGDDLHNNPDFLFLSANQSFDLSDQVQAYLRTEYTHIGKAESTSHDPFHTASSYELLNLTVGFELERYHSTVSLWGRNVLDEKYRMTGFDAAVSPGRVLATVGEPATYGITLRTNF